VPRVMEDWMKERVKQEHEFLDIAKYFHDEDIKKKIKNQLQQNPQLINAQPLGQEGRVRWSALHQTAYSGDVEDVKELLRCGASRTLRSKEGWTPWQLVEKICNALEKPEDEAESDQSQEQIELAYLKREVLRNPNWKNKLLDNRKGLLVELLPNQEAGVKEVVSHFFVVLMTGDVILTDQARQLLQSASLRTETAASLDNVVEGINKEYEERRADFFKELPCLNCLNLLGWICPKFEISADDVISLLHENFLFNDKELSSGWKGLADGLGSLAAVNGNMRLVMKHRVKHFKEVKCQSFKTSLHLYFTLFLIWFCSRALRVCGVSFILLLLYYIVKDLLMQKYRAVIWVLLQIPLYTLSIILIPLRKALLPRVAMIWIQVYRRQYTEKNDAREPLLPR